MKFRNNQTNYYLTIKRIIILQTAQKRHLQEMTALRGMWDYNDTGERRNEPVTDTLFLGKGEIGK